MTAIAADDTPEEWSMFDDIAVEVYSHFDTVERLADFNALIFFADRLLLDDEVHKVDLDEDDAVILHNFIDDAIKVEAIITKHLDINYISDYLETIETEDNDEQP